MAYNSVYSEPCFYSRIFATYWITKPMGHKFTASYSQELITPIGAMLAVATNDKLCLLEFTDCKKLDWRIEHLTSAINAVMKSGVNQILAQTQIQLDQYFAKTRQHFTIPLLLTGTKFQCSVWQALQQIPYGQTFYYQQQAERINRAKSVRAVANANGCNKMSIIIPCHRVIGKSGGLVGYASGLWRKQFLLSLEQDQTASPDTVNFA